MNHRELRRTFLEFYARRDHKIVPSMSLVPRDDPTMLFTSAGMVQFKPLWAGTVPLPYRRATSIQKCLRASDLAQVGHTPRHCTFFEMLGNFSFGDYFKYEAIPWAWEYLTEVVKLDRERLFVSVFREDDEAFNVWKMKVGLPESRIYRLGEKDNFWGPVGGGGACGPCSEIYVDLGPEYGCGTSTCAPGCDCNRFSEVYNIVFPQYNQLPDGTREPLKNRGIDTGMGLERLAMVSQGKKTIFETDLFAPLVKVTENVLGISVDDENRVMFYVAADHARALAFAIGDGALPSNEGRGYVLRGILRRALLFAHRRGVNEPFLYKVAGEVVELMRQWYPELAGKREQAAMIIKAEEDRFLKTLDSGLERWAGVLRQYRETGVIPGEELFKLHDTFGFHIELVKELAAESGVGLDITGFEQAMQEQRERSKKETFVGPVPVAGELESTFVGYDQDEVETELVRFTPLPDNRFEVVLKDSPFYAEMGGQVGDTGRIVGEDFELEVLDTHQQHGVRSCKARLVRGELRTGPVRAAVDVERRREIERAHTATHLLHAALRRTLGDYVKQEGSLVEPGRLRFDFAAFEPLGPEQIQAVERLVYEQVIADRKVEALRDLPLEQAKGLGALAFFGEQYGERVTVIKVGDFSMELCGGTHLRRTGQIGHFRIVSETGVAAGVRRIVALVGRAAQEQARQDRMTLDLLQQKLGTGEDTLVKKVDSLQQELKRLDNRVRALAGQLARAMGDELARSAADIGSVKVVVGHLSGFEAADLRLVADRVRELLTTQCVGLITGGDAARARYVVFSSPDVQQELPAGRLAKIVGSAMAGGGGGRPDIAEGGGEVERLSAAQHAFRTAIQETVEGRREG